MLSRLDHLILAVRDLEASEARLTGLLGRQVSWRGLHPGAGTANRLFRLDNTTVELLAPEGAGPVGELLRARLDAAGEGLVGLAFACEDLDACHAELQHRGLHPSPPAEGRGRSADGAVERRWRSLLLPADEGRGVVLLAIHHETPAAWVPPARALDEPASVVSGLDHVVLQTADPEAVRALYGEGLGLRLALDRRFDAWGVRLLFFRIGGLTVEAAARLKPEAPGEVQAPAPTGSASVEEDHLWGVSYRVTDVPRARERVAAAGFEVSELRTGRKPGTRVCTVRGEPLGAATLLIGPE